MLRIFALLTLLLTAEFCVGQNTILWEVSDTITGRKSFIVGTFHQFGNSFVDSIPQIKQAILKSNIAIFESVDDNPIINVINSRTSSNGIEKRLRKRDLEKLKTISKNWEVDIYKLKPIELSVKLQQEFQRVKCETVKPTDKWSHFDNYLIHIAEESNIELYGLETDTLQLDLINQEYKTPSWRNKKREIRFWINKMTVTELNTKYCQFANKYRNFELDYEFAKECPDNILVKQRNADWMKLLPYLISNSNCFIAVGFLHLKYQCGIIEELKAKGFVVNPIEIKASR